jgi:phosphatidylglycerophosphate synthase
MTADKQQKPSEGAFATSRKRNEGYLSTEFVTRPLAYPVALLARRLGMTPNAVTLLGGILWVVSVPVFALGGMFMGQGEEGAGWALWLVGAALWPVGVILDVADGSLARMTGTSSVPGHFLDFVFHMIFSPMFLAGIGMGLFLATGAPFYLVLGLLSICGNWGPSYAAKQNIVCDHVYKGELQPESMTDDERALLFLSRIAPKSPGGANGKCRRLPPLSQLAQEALFFPGQFTVFFVATVADFILWRRGDTSGFPCLRLVFCVVGVLAVTRVPFRVLREYRSLRSCAHVFDPGGEPESRDDDA